MAQDTINQRLKILIESLELSTRGFSKAIGVSDTNTRNYLDRGSKPNSDYLEKVLRQFEHISPAWLLTGQGEMFTNRTSESVAPYQKNFGGNNNVNQSSGGAVSQANHEGGSSQLLEAAQREIELLKNQLRDKERIIQLLENQSKNFSS